MDGYVDEWKDPGLGMAGVMGGWLIGPLTSIGSLAVLN